MPKLESRSYRRFETESPKSSTTTSRVADVYYTITDPLYFGARKSATLSLSLIQHSYINK